MAAKSRAIEGTPFLQRFTATEGRVDVGTIEFGKALTAVLPHAANPKNDTGGLAVVRVYVDHVSALVTATNRYHAGLADVSLGLGDGPGDTFWFDLSVATAKEILAGFKADAKNDTPESYAVTRIDVAATKIVVRDVSGFLPGKEYKYPRSRPVKPEPNEDGSPRMVGPNTLPLFKRAAHTVIPFTDTMRVGGAPLAAFAKAATVYRGAVSVRAWGTPPTAAGREFRPGLLVAIGDQFQGLMMSYRPDDGGAAEVAAQQSWLDRFGPAWEGEEVLTDDLLAVPDPADEPEDVEDVAHGGSPNETPDD